MAAVTIEEMRRREDEAYDTGWKAAMKKSSKGRIAKILVAVTTLLFSGAFVFCLGAWLFMQGYPEQLLDIAFKAFSLMGGGYIVKSGAENYGRITHAEEYNQNYPDA